MTTAGRQSPTIYSTGAISVTGATLTATGGEGGVIDGANSISITSSTLTSKLYGVKVFRSTPGSGTATVTINGGSFNVTAGDAFYVTTSSGAATAAITVRGGASIGASTGNLVNADTGSTVTFTLDGEALTGNVLADSTSKVTAILQNRTTLAGTVTRAALTLDSTSVWTLTGTSVLTALTDASGISGASITNIAGKGYNVTYDASLSANAYLAGKTYSLVNGGYLLPAGTAAPSGPAITSAGVVNAASYAAGVAPGAWISIFGSNLASTTAVATTSDLVNGYLPTTLGGVSVTIDGKNAYMNYVSPTQINAQAPADSTSGSVTLTVTNSSGSSSASVAEQAVLPGLFTTPASFVLAVRNGDGVIINGDGAPMTGYSTAAAAKPGDSLQIYGTGLGATTTTIAPGLVFSGTNYPAVSMPRVTIGGTDAAVGFCGLVGAGLYQINVTVPSGLSAGTYSVVVTQSEVSSPSTAMLKIAAM